MVQLIQFRVMVVVLALSLMESSLSAQFGTNLITNESFEDIVFLDPANLPLNYTVLETGQPVDVVAWEESGVLTLDFYTGQYVFRNPPPGSGDLVMFGGDSRENSTSVTQTLDLSFASREIALGEAGYSISAFLGSFDFGIQDLQNDIATLSIGFLDENGNQIDVATLIGPTDPKQVGLDLSIGGNYSGLVATSDLVPVEAREAVVSIDFTLDGPRGFNNANVDLVDFQLSLGFEAAGPNEFAFIDGERVAPQPDPGGEPLPEVTIEVGELDILPGGSFELGPNETLQLNHGDLFIAEGAVFTGNGIILGNVLNAGLLRIPIVRIGTLASTTGGVGGGHVQIELPEPEKPNDPIVIPTAVTGGSGEFTLAPGILVSFVPVIVSGGGGGGSTPPIVIDGPVPDNSGTIRFDASLEVTGSYEQTETGALRMFIAGQEAGVNYSQLIIGEDVTLNGQIQIVFQPELFSEFDYAPEVGQTFDLITAVDGITIDPSGIELLNFTLVEDSELLDLSNYTLTPYDSGYAADPDNLLQIEELLFSWELVENDTIFRVTLVESLTFVPEPTGFALLLCGVLGWMTRSTRKTMQLLS